MSVLEAESGYKAWLRYAPCTDEGRLAEYRRSCGRIVAAAGEGAADGNEKGIAEGARRRTCGNGFGNPGIGS